VVACDAEASRFGTRYARLSFMDRQPDFIDDRLLHGTCAAALHRSCLRVCRVTAGWRQPPADYRAGDQLAGLALLWTSLRSVALLRPCATFYLIIMAPELARTSRPPTRDRSGDTTDINFSECPEPQR